jgi:hypothetical protein
MAPRRHISWKTKCAAAVLAFNHYRYIKDDDPLHITFADAKRMTEDQFLSLFHWDHYPILYETEHPDRDLYWNLSPMFIAIHRKKTKADAKIIAKSRRIRKRLNESANEIHGVIVGTITADGAVHPLPSTPRLPTPRLRSRGFDKTRTRGFDGKVRPRK